MGLQAFTSLWVRITENFRERMEVRRAFIDIQATNYENKRAIEKRTAVITSWREEHDESEELPADLREYQSTVEIIQKNVKDNNVLAERHQQQLRGLEDTYRQLQHDIPAKVTAQERRQLLEMLVHSQELEVENMELELQNQIKDKIIADQKETIQTNCNNFSRKVSAITPINMRLASAGDDDEDEPDRVATAPVRGLPNREEGPATPPATAPAAISPDDSLDAADVESVLAQTPPPPLRKPPRLSPFSSRKVAPVAEDDRDQLVSATSPPTKQKASHASAPPTAAASPVGGINGRAQDLEVLELKQILTEQQLGENKNPDRRAARARSGSLTSNPRTPTKESKVCILL
eukprot:TRINITY_DN2529_c0_g1_i1.p2 TRINITY_DN2529_c0_g1~~TRINITY_DN2529_c0_g1_i1.p2  ORF type:complete len:349 (-),score=102.08 TRINITY_DN2529_c0_g1_i1:105-1151(-)